MINTTILNERVHKYQKSCFDRNKKPTFIGLGYELGISGQTVSRIDKGLYKEDRRYTDTPHPNRCIDNNDFEVIRALFK